MRVATWNINGLRARLDFVTHWLRSRQPDIVGLQELKLTEESFPYSEFENLGYFAAVHGQKAWNGVAVLSRERPRTRQLGLPGQEAAGARLVAVEVGELAFLTIYCPNGKHVGHPDFPEKLKWLQSLRDYLAQNHATRKPLILCGDFNICPTPLDSWDEERLKGRIFHTEQERQQFQGLLEWGLIDLYRNRFPKTQGFSWWDYRGGAFHRNQGLRIDFLLASQLVQQRLLDVQIDRDYRKKKEGLTASDHAPVIADLR